MSQNYQKANLTLEEYLKLNPDSENAVIIKIQCLVKLGLLKEAQTEIENYKDISLSDDFKILSSKLIMPMVTLKPLKRNSRCSE